MTKTTAKFAAVATLTAVALALSACGGQPAAGDSADSGDAGSGGSVTTDGSSTVAPLTEAAADLFREQDASVNVSVATSGTGGGFKAFCADETDISNASRPIKDEEAAECEANGVEFTEIIAANDGLSVIINPENDWATDLTLEQLAKIWAPASEGTVTSWADVDPSFPDVPLVLFGAGTDSGTFDYFTEEVNGETGAIRTDYSPSEDDNITIQGVAGDEGAIGFLGLSYVEENEGTIVAASIDGVYPSTETVQDGTYTPLGRPLFIYVKNAAYADKPQVKEFVDFYVANSDEIAELALFVPLTQEQITVAQEELASLG
ncbi:PstS family phosphate ABC transporter substrate-binding protein [Microbacterium sp. zg-Y818]|uniref:PstS family phosphate ABC transporter substrate-binding protein n=1 Tax=unclassified Microbacterium TaxID=2609290 RepID=UPI00214B1A15|nr:MULTISPECIES: PstS family phosphate ABC transporter substrate-binding protein [unclassified Microbacterium]MCR2800580.1 PstS family phosphate ABC transporter substrate-binding protein [Microbacterium sp. zg.Y818]WIM23309.1 PstS family phosphate ABC transporter substrate-binding protein [Microbacterium sp. zg-Y818]